MKKIGILAFVNKDSGGTLQYTQSLIDALYKEKTYQYIIFTDSDTDSINTYNLEVRKVSVTKLNHIKKFIKGIQLLALIKAPLFESVNKEAYEDIDLFFSPRVILYTQFFASKPFILTLHDIQEAYYPEYFSFQLRIMRFIVNRFLCKNAKKIICESNYVRQDIEKHLKINKDKIIVIPAPPPIQLLNIIIDEKEKSIIKGKYNLPDNYIFYPASFWPHKNHIKLIEAFNLVLKRNKNIYLVLSGAKQNNYLNVINHINKMNLDKRIILIGYIDYKDLPYLFSMSQVMVMPSLFESISIPIYEAFALKVPVCASNVVAIPEQVGDAGVLFNPNDKKDIADKLCQLLEDNDLQQILKLKGIERIKGYSHLEYTSNLLFIINKIIN